MPTCDENKPSFLNVVEFDPNGSAGVLLQLREYWESLRKGQSVPLRSDVSAQGMQRVLEHAFLVERLAPGTARFRLAGRHLVDLMGMEVRGMSLNALMNQSSRRKFCAVLETVFSAPQIAELRLSAKADFGCPEIAARMLLLPLKSDLGDVTRALGCLVTKGDSGVRPRRLDLVSDFLSPVISGGQVVLPNLPTLRSDIRKTDKDLEKTKGQAPDQSDRQITAQQRRSTFRVITKDGSKC